MLLNFIEVAGTGRIAQSYRPRPGAGLEQDMRQLKDAGVDVVVSCLTEDEEQKLGLGPEASVARATGLKFLRHPIVDHDVPASTKETLAFVDTLAERLAKGEAVVLHCFAGIGRSGMLTVATLVRAGWPLERALDQASVARGCRVPETPAQRAWLIRTLAADPSEG